VNHSNNVIEEIDKVLAKHDFKFDRGFGFMITDRSSIEFKRKSDQLRNDGIIVKEGIH